MIESYPEAAAILAGAGWKPHDVWQVYTCGTLVMGLQPDGRAFHVKNWGMDVHGPDTPDDPVEAAQWLVARFAEPAQIPADEADSKSTLVSASEGGGGVDHPESPAGLAEGGGGAREEGAGNDAGCVLADPPADAQGLDHETDSKIVPEGGPSDEMAAGVGQVVSSAHDADFAAIEGADLDPLALPAPDVPDFDPDEIAPADKVAEAVAIFGDDLPMARLVLIGRVTQLGNEMKAALQEGWTLAEFASLQNAVLRVSQGLAPDDPHLRARFEAISEASRAMSAIQSHMDAQVAFLETASREEIQTYKPEDGWP